MFSTQINCCKNFVIICLLTCFTSCISSLKGSSYEGPSTSVETNIMISVFCPAPLMDELMQECLSIQAPQQLSMNRIVPLHSNSQFQLSYRFINTSDLNRILSLLDEKSSVMYSVSKL